MKNLNKRIVSLLEEHEPRNFLDICTALNAEGDDKMEVYRTLNTMKTEKAIVEETPYGTLEIGYTLPGLTR